MKKAFKYLKREHALSLINDGSLRIGTLYEYRKEEEHGSQIGDKSEGIITKRMQGPVTITENNFPDFLKESNVKIVLKNGASINVVGSGVISVKNSAEDCYIYSISETFNKKTMHRLNSNACIKILDVDKFFKLISENDFLRQTTYYGYPKCIYGHRVIPHDAIPSCHPAILKDYSYSYQAERRAIWVPQSKITITPQIITVPSIGDLCKIHHID